MKFELTFDLIGIILFFVLFFFHPHLQKGKPKNNSYKVSVVIPARNEERNIANIIGDLKKQTYQPYEIIIVDDMSSDNTKRIASKSGATVICVENKPEGWMGKTWACHTGSKAAKGDVLLFVDADVRIKKGAIAKLLYEYEKREQTISVQPFHLMKKKYEHFSLLFNLIEICANGVTSIIPSRKLGLFGPVILIDKSTYNLVQGHRGVSDKVVEDLSLGIVLRKRNIPFSLLLGSREDFTFRMYSAGFKSLWQGWVKNFATGATNTSLFLVVLIVIWSGAGLSSIIHLSQAFAQSNWIYGSIFSVIFLTYGVLMYLQGRKVGNYPWWIIFLHPIYTLIYFLIFFVSLYKKIFYRKVTWKDRKIRGDK